ncbi:MAG: type III secretion system chaperone [Planctomycetaceae bacterium]
MKLTRRDWMTVGGLAGLAAVTAPAMAQEAVPAAAVGKVSEAQLGEMLAALGLQADKKAQRYDFAFVAPLDDQQWELSMSAVLSQDQSSLWVMAWLDELPKSSADVPRTALLRLLAENDQLGSGKFFAYIPANRRFVLQQVVANENMTSAKLRYILQDLGSSVIDTYGIWSVQSWNSTEAPPVPAGGSAAVAPPSPEGGAARTVTNDPNFEQPVRR